MDKSPDAFRTISEVADHLDTPAHVLRFWESRFTQIKPVKRAGGRRYYRPSDVALLAGIKRLLHDEGLTIRGVQKILREQGVRHVAGLSDSPVALDDLVATETEAEAAPEDVVEVTAALISEPSHQPTPVQVALPLFDRPADPEPAPVAPPPRPREDVAFASRIRALSPDAFGKNQPQVAALARRLATLRARMRDAAEGGRG